MKASAIAKSSPLYEYWKTNQDANAERKRLLIANHQSKAVALFINEPYKWENLYQSIVREIARGDYASIKGLKILLETVNEDEACKAIKSLRDQNIFNPNVFNLITNLTDISVANKKNTFRFIKILFAIFLNPYGIEIRRKKSHIYEKTGSMAYDLKKILFPRQDL